MVKTKSYEQIVKSFDTLLPEDMDKREGTVAYMAISAMAMGLAELYQDLKIVEENAYALTAVGDQLDMIVKMLGITRCDKTKAVVRVDGTEGFDVGTILCAGETEYELISVKDGYYLAECSVAGEEGNSYTGEVVLKNDTAGEYEFAVTEIVAKGKEKETDEQLRQRYIARLNCPLCTGNLTYYRQVLAPVSGVGAVKVVAAPEGAGTVKVIITNSDYSIAGEELLDYVKEVLDPEESSGLGYGLVPIGHSVKVESVQKVDVDIVLEINGSRGSRYNDYLRGSFLAVIDEINRTWGECEHIELWDHVIEEFMREKVGRDADINVISINGNQNRLILKENEILGVVTVNGV